jgi:hypothetical protein
MSASVSRDWGAGAREDQLAGVRTMVRPIEELKDLLVVAVKPPPVAAPAGAALSDSSEVI